MILASVNLSEVKLGPISALLCIVKREFLKPLVDSKCGRPGIFLYATLPIPQLDMLLVERGEEVLCWDRLDRVGLLVRPCGLEHKQLAHLLLDVFPAYVRELRVEVGMDVLALGNFRFEYLLSALNVGWKFCLRVGENKSKLVALL